IVDGHALVRRGIRSVLEHQRDLVVVGEAANGQTAARMADLLKPDIVLLDPVTPTSDSSGLVRSVGRGAPRARMIVLIPSCQNADMIVQAVRAGVQSYLLKDIQPAELVRAVRATARGEAVVHPRIGSRVLSCHRRDHATEALTRREREVLVRIARGQSN